MIFKVRRYLNRLPRPINSSHFTTKKLMPRGTKQMAQVEGMSRAWSWYCLAVQLLSQSVRTQTRTQVRVKTRQIKKYIPSLHALIFQYWSSAPRGQKGKWHSWQLVIW